MTDPNRMSRALLALEGLSVGDAFGERFFVHPDVVEQLISDRAVPRGPWRYTDDTEMALAIMDTLRLHGEIDRNDLARQFVRRYAKAPDRGYGGGAHRLLMNIAQGTPWEVAASELFDGGGSYGNGGAMRSAPVGAYFADDMDAVVAQARRSAEVTHAHPEGKAGGIAIAIAAATACRLREAGSRDFTSLFDSVLEYTPPSEVRDNIAKASRTPLDASVQAAVNRLGNGSRISAQDTCGISIWFAVRHLDDYEEAMWQTVSALGDRDTTCAIVGGIVACYVGWEAIPGAWRELREPLR